MLTVSQAFDQFRQNLELNVAEQADATTCQESVRQKLQEHLGGIAEQFLTGSYARRTAIRPLDDIDLFVVLDPTAHRAVYPSDTVKPSAVLTKVRTAILTAWPTSGAPILQNRSVRLHWNTATGGRIGFDIVPAFANKAGVYIIPDRERDAWIQTNPAAHRAALGAADGKAGSMLNPLIKMAKLARNVREVELRSFHLEVMAYGAFATAPARYPEGIHALFGYLASAILSTCADPAGVGPNIDAGMTQEKRTKAREALLAAEVDAGKALAHEKAGQIVEAHGLWKRLFGAAYPEG